MKGKVLTKKKWEGMRGLGCCVGGDDMSPRGRGVDRWNKWGEVV